MQLKNSRLHFGLIAILFHWIMAILIIAMLALGLYMADLPVSAEKLKLYGWHKEYGLIILALAILRLSWRLINLSPVLNLPWYELIAAKLSHWALYGLMIAMPLTGWLMSSSAGISVSFFGLFTLPDLIAPSESLRPVFRSAHEFLADALIALIVIHSAAALKHHFYDKDDILRRMIR